jgi:hypothetical protein
MGVNGEDNIKIYDKEIGFTMLTEFRKLRIGSVSGFQVYFIIWIIAYFQATVYTV